MQQHKNTQLREYDLRMKMCVTSEKETYCMATIQQGMAVNIALILIMNSAHCSLMKPAFDESDCGMYHQSWKLIRKTNTRTKTKAYITNESCKQ